MPERGLARAQAPVAELAQGLERGLAAAPVQGLAAVREQAPVAEQGWERAAVPVQAPVAALARDRAAALAQDRAADPAADPAAGSTAVLVLVPTQCSHPASLQKPAAVSLPANAHCRRRGSAWSRPVQQRFPRSPRQVTRHRPAHRRHRRHRRQPVPLSLQWRGSYGAGACKARRIDSAGPLN